MIVDRHDPVNLFEMVPKLKLEFEPELAQLDRLLDDDVLFTQVKADLARRYPNSARLGRHSTPVEVILRMLWWSSASTIGVMSLPRAFRPRLDSLEAVVQALPREYSRRHHPDPLGQPGGPRDSRVA